MTVGGFQWWKLSLRICIEAKENLGGCLKFMFVTHLWEFHLLRWISNVSRESFCSCLQCWHRWVHISSCDPCSQAQVITDNRLKLMLFTFVLQYHTQLVKANKVIFT